MPRLFSLIRTFTVGALALTLISTGMGCGNTRIINTSKNLVTVTSVTPGNGPFTGGTLISLVGARFTPGATVTIGGNPCTSITVVSSTALTCVTPANAIGMINIVVTNLDGTSGSLAQSYTYRHAVTPVAGLAVTSGGSHLSTGGGYQMSISIRQVGRPSYQTAAGTLMLPGIQGTFYKP